MKSLFLLSLLFLSASSFLTRISTDSLGLGPACSAPLSPSSTSQYWVEYIKHEGTAPFNGNPSSYPIYRNVRDYGAKGDGVTDDTASINAAITAGNRCGKGCDSATVVPALVYFPEGKYLVSSPIIQYYYTQLVGNALNPPTLLASTNFAGIAVIDSDPYDNTGANWWTNQNNFFRQVRNLIIDVSHVVGSATGIHWQVAQATSLTNLVFKMATDGRNHQGMFMENGSGGFMSDLLFDGGKIGMWVGNQQFTFRNITVQNAASAIIVGWNWGFTFKGLKIKNCQLGVDMTAGGQTAQQVGSVIIMDSSIENTPIFVKTSTSAGSSPKTSGSLILDNIRLSNVNIAIQSFTGATILGSSSVIDSWGQGYFYSKSGQGSFKQQTLDKPAKPSVLLDSNGNFFEKSFQQYENYQVSDFISVKSQGAKGDGKTDDTAAIQSALTNYAGCKIIYFPAGFYVVTSTIYVPPGTRIIGEAWPVIAASGAFFQDESNPVPMLQVGKAGEQGLVEISDIIFATQGQAPGAILVEWNIRDPDGNQGAAGMWDAHFRIGGALGTKLDSTNCQKFTASTSNCKASYLALHLTPSSSAYLENVWVWTSDHDLDNGHSQISIFNARGVLIESTNGPVWMYGTASEHHTLYQYNLVNTKNVVMGLIQTETPYYQSAPPAPSPFTVNSNLNDPDFSRCGASLPCAMAWGLRVKGSSDVFVYGAGLYNFFQNYDQGCLTGENCQEAMVEVDGQSNGVHVYNLNTKASTKMVTVDEVGVVYQADNRNTFCSTITGFLV